VLATIGLALFTELSTTTSLLEIGIIEAILGIGLSFYWPANTSAIMSSTPPAKYGVGSGIMITFRNTGMILSFALSLTAATSVIPPNIVNELFIGNLNGKLSSSLANSYLSGESFAFEIAVALLLLSLAFTVMTGRKKSVGISKSTYEKESQH
jgi:hypothetical protein